MIIFPFDYRRLFLENILILISDVMLFRFLVIWLFLFFHVYINYFNIYLFLHNKLQYYIIL